MGGDERLGSGWGSFSLTHEVEGSEWQAPLAVEWYLVHIVENNCHLWLYAASVRLNSKEEGGEVVG